MSIEHCPLCSTRYDTDYVEHICGEVQEHEYPVDVEPDEKT